MLGATSRQQLGRERFLAYIAFTRARERLLLTSALQDANGGPLNPSPFLSQLKQLFPSLQFEMVPRTLDWRDSEHESELVGEILKVRSQDAGTGSQETAHLKSTTPQPPDPGPTAIELSNLPSEAAMSSPSPPL